MATPQKPADDASTPAGGTPATSTAATTPLPPAPPTPVDANGRPYVYAPPPQRQYLLTWLYALFLGMFGGDRFYLGKVGTAILKLITLGGLGLWWAIDLIITILGAQTDAQHRPTADYERYRKVSWIITAIAVFIALVLAVTRSHMGFDWWGPHPVTAPEHAVPSDGADWCFGGACRNS